MEYRTSREQDIHIMAQIRAASPELVDYWEKRISGYLKLEHYPQFALVHRIIFVAVEENELVGLIAGHLSRRFQCEGELEWIDVLPAFRRRGIASGLLKRLADWFIEQQAFRICVNCAPENTIAVSFYKRNGAESLNAFWLIWKDIRVVTNSRY